MLKYKNRKLHKRGLYAITTGDYIGQFFVFIEEIDKKGTKVHKILSLPDMQLQYISDQHVKQGLKSGILDLIRILPKNIYNHCCKEFSYQEQKLINKYDDFYDEFDNRRK